MPFDQVAFNAEITALANKYEVEIIGTAVPVAAESDSFDINAPAVPTAPAAEEAVAADPSDVAPVAPVDTTVEQPNQPTE